MACWRECYLAVGAGHFGINGEETSPWLLPGPAVKVIECTIALRGLTVKPLVGHGRLRRAIHACRGETATRPCHNSTCAWCGRNGIYTLNGGLHHGVIGIIGRQHFGFENRSSYRFGHNGTREACSTLGRSNKLAISDIKTHRI